MKIDLLKISKDNIMSIPYNSSTDNEQKSKVSTRINDKNIKDMPLSDDDMRIEFRKKLTQIFFDKTKGVYANLDAKTLIREDTFRKWQSDKIKKRPQRHMLAKFAVGLGLDFETTNELFTLHSNALDLKNNRLDYIIACAIKDRDDIEQFCNDVEEYCGLQLL